MVFSSITFLFYFLAAVLLIYYIVPQRAKNPVLFAASLIFYAWGEPVYILLMLFSIAFNFASGIFIEKTEHKKLALTVNIIVNLGLLVFFKYTAFLLSLVGIDIAFNIALPIGISFYTFQALSYTVDVYRKNAPVQHSFINFGLYLALFPQLIAGPIVRYNDIARQLDFRRSTGKRFVDGFSRFCAGMCKKVLIANNVGLVWSTISTYDFTGLSMANAWLGIICFTLQIYFDFSGYSDMAIGLGKMLGFEFRENFRYPYTSKSITEFWNRWHISLSSWFKEYVYIPLGGNRKGSARMYLNLLIVWLLTGLWHGASINFVLWGLYYAVILIIEKTFLRKILSKTGIFANIYTLILVMIGWVLFSVEDLSAILSYIKAMFNFSYMGFGEQDFLYNLTSYARILIIAVFVASGVPKKLYNRILPQKYRHITYIFAVIGLIICTAYITNDSFNPFLYFRF